MGTEAIPQGGDCAPSCTTPLVQQVPGPQGAAGANGTNGTNGVNAFTSTAQSFTMPAVSSTVTINVLNSAWIALNQVVYVTGAGYMQATGLPNATQVTLKNLGYAGNTTGGSTVATSQALSPSGIEGPQGPTGVGSTLNEISPTTTKGDVIVDNGANSPLASCVRMGVDTNGKVLTCDSTEPLGVAYETIDLSGVKTSFANTLGIVDGGTGQNTQQTALNALCNSVGSFAGDLMRFNGTNWIRFPRGTAFQVLTVEADGFNIVWGNLTGTIQEQLSLITAYSTITSALAISDTIPTAATGTNLFSVSFTPISLVSTVSVEVLVPVAPGTATNVYGILGNGATNAVAIGMLSLSAENYMGQLLVKYEYQPASLSAITFTLNIASTSASGVFINGTSAGRSFGGISAASMKIREYIP